MFPTPEPDDADSSFADDDLIGTARWTSRVLADLPRGDRPALPGIVSPLSVTVDFASNSQHDAVSITMGNGRVRLAGGLRRGTSGPLGLRLDWSDGFHAHGIGVGDALGEWTVERVGRSQLVLRGDALGPDHREAELPMVSVVKTSGAEAGDEVTVRVWGEAEEFRGAAIRGWSRG
ncbi:MAG: hypothetical protein Q7T71_10015 [Herbiconiux sp.]|nr:hypothetical protein [Herbiconiux sp.]